MVPESRIIINDCASPPLPGLTPLRTRNTEFGDRNISYSYGDVVAGLPDRLTDIQLDWLHILGSIYAADIATKRGGGNSWSRRIRLWIGVRQPDMWRPLTGQFEQIFKALTFDEFTLHFVADQQPAPPPRQSRDPFPDADSVALVSGGVDSLTGAAMLINSGRTPLLISHQNSGATGKALHAVDEGLARIGNHAGRYGFTARPHQFEADSSQRSRSMLYMGIACLVAACLGRNDVYLNENGIMAINVPLTEARIGSYSTHTCSPNIVRDFAQLASTALRHRLRVHNLIVASTKPEVVARAADLGLRDILPKTVSCWQIGRTGRHCGYCVPCIVRQISFEYAEVADADYHVRPLDQTPPTAPWRDRATDNVVHLATHVTALSETDDFDMDLEFTEMINCGEQLTRYESFAMHRRWAEQCLTIMARHPFAARLLGN